jgi:imidazolonepropionase-like amidohydrolase
MRNAKTLRGVAARVAAVSVAAIIAATALSAAPAHAQIAVRGETVYTMAGAPITDGVVLIRDGKIEHVGPASSVQIPAGFRQISARVVTPGLIDAHTVVGLAGYLNQPHDQDQIETSAPMQPELRALDAYNAREALVDWLREHGVTTLHTGHAPGALISGQTMLVKTRSGTVNDAVMVPTAMIAVTLGTAGLAADGRAPGSRSKAVAMLRAELVKAKEYSDKLAGPADGRPGRDLRLEALAQVIRREIPLLVTAHRVQDILTALRIGTEFGIRIVLDGVAEAHLVTEQIRAAKVPVIVHPTMLRASGDAEQLSMENAAILSRAGITIAMQSGFEGYVPKTRVVLFEAAVAAAYGLPFDQALATITTDAARLLGIDSRVGSIVAGKDADLALFDGDPFEYTTKVTAVLIDGVVVSEVAR